MAPSAVPGNHVVDPQLPRPSFTELRSRRYDANILASLFLVLRPIDPGKAAARIESSSGLPHSSRLMSGFLSHGDHVLSLPTSLGRAPPIRHRPQHHGDLHLTNKGVRTTAVIGDGPTSPPKPGRRGCRQLQSANLLETLCSAAKGLSGRRGSKGLDPPRATANYADKSTFCEAGHGRGTDKCNERGARQRRGAWPGGCHPPRK